MLANALDKTQVSQQSVSVRVLVRMRYTNKVELLYVLRMENQANDVRFSLRQYYVLPECDVM